MYSVKISNFKFQILLLIPVVLLLLVVPSSVSAHVLKTDGSIGAVLHINPNDEPTVQEPATFIFEFKDKNGNFQSPLCTCTVAITANNKTLYTQPILQESTNTDMAAAVTYTFTKPDIYQVTLKGTPLNDHTFQPFRLSWDIRVGPSDRQNDKQQNAASSLSPFTILFTIVLIGAIIGVSFQFIDNKKKNTF